MSSREDILREQRRALPDSPGVYLFKDAARPRALRRQGEVDPQARRLALHAAATRPRRSSSRASSRSTSSRPQTRRRRCSPSRTSSSSTGRRSTSGCATTSPTPTSGSRWRSRSRASTSRASATARSAPTSAPSRAPSACARRSTCSASSSRTGPATGREPGRASGSPCLDYYIKRCQAPCVGYVSAEEYRENIDAIVGFLSGRYRDDRAGAGGADARGGREPGVRAGGRVPEPAARRAVAVRAPAGRERGGRHARRDRGRGRRHRRQRAGVPGARRRAGRPPELLPGEPGRPQRGRGGRGVHDPVLRDLALDPGRDRRAARRSAMPRPCASCSSERREGPVELRHARARREAPDLRAGRAQRAPRARAGQAARRSAAASSASTRSTTCARRSSWTRCRSGSSASTSRTSAPTHTVASMVVFEGGAPKKSDYRRFKIRKLDGRQDDFAAIGEVLSRRMAQFLEQRDRSPHDPAHDASFAALPGLIVIDGGKGQLSSGVAALERADRRGRRRGQPREAPRGGLRARTASSRSCCRASRPRCSCCSGSATRRTGSRSSTTGCGATAR